MLEYYDSVELRFEVSGQATGSSEKSITIDVGEGIGVEEVITGLLTPPNAEDTPYYEITATKKVVNWGASSTTLEIVVTVLESPWVSGVFAGLMTEGVVELLRRLPGAVRLMESSALSKAQQFLVLQGEVSEVAELELREIEWSDPPSAAAVVLRSSQCEYTVMVQNTRSGDTSCALKAKSVRD